MPQPVLVHGLWHSSRVWDAWIPFLSARDVDAVVVDWPCEQRGVVDVTRTPPGFDDVVARVQAVLNRVDRPVLVGAGAGAFIADAAAELLPVRGVARLAPLSLTQANPVDPAGRAGQLFSGASPQVWAPATAERWLILDAGEYADYMGTAIDRAESDELWRRFSAPCPGRLLLQLRAALLTRGPVMAGSRPLGGAPQLHVTVGPSATGVGTAGTVNEIRTGMQRSSGPDDAPPRIVEMTDRGQTLMVDSGWMEVATVVCDWIDEVL